MSLPQLARKASCASTDEARHLTQELIAAGLCEHNDRAGFFSPRILAYQQFRAKCAAAGKRGGGNPALSTFKPSTFKEGPKGSPKGWSKGWSKGSPSDGSSPPLTPLSSLPPPENREEAEETRAREGDAEAALRLAEARSFAKCWISANRPDHLRDGVRPFTKLVVLLGKSLAVEEVKTAAEDAGIANPFAVAWANHDPQRRPAPAARNGNGSNGAHPPRRMRGEDEQAVFDGIEITE